MSQSDYIKHLKLSTQLLLDAGKNKLPVFDSSVYLDYKDYVLENTIVDTNITYSTLTPSGKQIVFGMERNVTNCPTTYECVNTNRRANRTPLPSVYYTPTPQPLNWKEKKNAKWLKTPCDCRLNSKNTLRNICKCKISI